jgi:catechol 2,3-dioxygenase-like lactoylglutathione lyase family enzyme
MLSDYEVIPTLPTSDLKRARAFYEQVLGFVAHTVENEGVIYNTGTSRFMVYPSAFGGTNQATTMAFQVPHAQFDAEVAALREAGVTLDTFEFADAVWEDGVMHLGEERGVWFRDPDGNTISVETH